MANAPNVATFTAIMDHGQFDAEVGKMKNSAEQAGMAAANAGQSFSNTAKKTGAFSSSAKNLGGKLKDLEPTIGRAASGLSGMAGALGGAVGQTNALGGAVAGLAGAFSGGGLLAVGLAGATLGLGLLFENAKKANDEAMKAHSSWVDGYAKALMEARNSTKSMGSRIESLRDRIGELTMGTFEYQRQLAIGKKMELEFAREEFANVDEKRRIAEEESAALGKARENARRQRDEMLDGTKETLRLADMLFNKDMERIMVREGELEAMKLDLSFQEQRLQLADEDIANAETIIELMDEQRILEEKKTKESKKQTDEKKDQAKVTARIISVEKIDDDLKGSFEDFDELRKEEARALEDQRKQRLRLFAQAAKVQQDQAKEEERIQKEKLKNIEDAEKESQERKLAALRLYTSEAASLINGAFALSLDALEAVVAGEKVMLHEMIIAYTTSTMKQAGIRIFGSGLATFIEGMLANSVIPGSGANAVSSGAVAMGIGASLGAGGAVGSGLATRFGIVGGGDAAPGGMTPGVNGGNISAGGSRGRAEESGQQRNVYVFNSPVYSDLTETAKNASRLQKIARDDLLERV